MSQLRLFGGAALDSDAGPVTGRAAQRHRIALLALLATTRRLYRSRDQLITLLWPESDVVRGRKLLSDSIYRLNQALGGDVLVAIGDDLRLNRAHLTCDVALLEAAADMEDWRTVADLFRGEFLDGFFVPGSPDFDQWMDGERAHYQRIARKALETLATEARDAGRHAEALERWQRLAELAPDDSRVSMELMRALEASGNRAGALRQARVHATVLRDTIGIEPDKEVLQLTSQISRSRSSGATVGATIAVLPFSATNDAESNAYLADGISEELIILLSRMHGLRVASRTSSFAFRDRHLDVRELARRLNVGWVLEGSVRRSGNGLRIAAQLIDATNGFQIWSESFDQAAGDICSIQEEIASAIAARLRPTIMENATNVSEMATRGPADPVTYDLYLQARFHWHRRTEESLRTSISLLEKVVTRDPSYARASVGVADAYAVMAFYDYLPPHIAWPRAESAARHAIKLDATLAAPHATIAYVDTYYRWEWVAAEEGFRRAIALEPMYSTTHQWYANLLTARGRFVEAEATMRRAAELDPLSMIAHSAIAWVMMFANQPDRAIRHLQGALQLDPGFCLAHYWMGLALIRNDEARMAIPYFRRSLELNASSAHQSVRGRAGLARAFAAVGEEAEAYRILDDLLEEQRNGRYVPAFQVGKVYHALGDVSKTLDFFERSYEERGHSMAYLRIDPQLWPLTREPRFRKLLENVEAGSRARPTHRLAG